MSRVRLSRLAALLAILTALWLALLIAEQAGAPRANTLDDAIAALAQAGTLRTAIYINAALLTAITVALFAGLRVELAETPPLWAAIGAAFVPIYGLANLAAYLSQLYVTPTLLRMLADPTLAEPARALLAMTIHTWPGSAVAFLNGLAYAALGVPSIVFGLVLSRRRGKQGIAGWLLAISGALSLVALAGMGLRVGPLASLSVVSGGVFLLALPFLAVGLARNL